MSFQMRYHEEADLFDKFLPYEDVAKFEHAFVVAKISK